MEAFEEQTLATAPEPPRIWKRCIDDTFTVMKQHNADNFLSHLNQQHPSIRFTMETENNNRIAFLDTLVTRKLNIESYVLLQHQDDLHVVVNNYVKERVVTVRPSAPRYTVEVTAEKRKLRQLERKWRASRLPADRVRYVHQCNVVINLIKSLKSEYYSSIIKENSGNKKVLFKSYFKSQLFTTIHPPKTTVSLLMNLLPFSLLRLIHYIMISLLKRKLLFTLLIVSLMRYSQYLRLNFQLLLR